MNDQVNREAPEVDLPYFEDILQLVDAENPDFQTAYARHVHWGFWRQPEQADSSPADFALAAENMSREVLAVAEIATGQKILDAGCGFGGTVASMNERWSNLHLVGLNIDPRQLDRARRMITARPSNKIDFVEGDACNLPFDDQSFDRILAVECIFHFPSRKQFFSEAKRTLKRGGKLFISDIVPSPLLMACKGVVQPIIMPALERTFGRIKNDCSVSQYLNLARDTGFCNPIIHDVTRQTIPTHSFMRKLYKTNAPDIYRRQRAQETAVEFLSRIGLLRYVLMAWTAA